MRLQRSLAVFVCLLVALAFDAFAQSALPPAPPMKLAVNPVTNKVYATNTSANTVTAFNAATGTNATIAVGAGPSFIAVNPATNRVYVNNARDASMTVIDGDTDTVIGTFPIGSSGPISVNPVTNVVYVVRLTGTGSDEVTFFNGNTNTWYTIATSSFQPNAMAVNPLTDTIYVAHYATGDVRVISGAFDPANDFPATVSVGVFSHPFAIAANAVTNKIYAITEDSRGPIAIIDGATNGATFPAVLAGHATGPRAIAVNPVSNKVYAAFANEVIVIDGATGALAYVPISGAGSGGVALAINYATNRIFAATELGTLDIIDGDTNAVTTRSIPAGTSVVGVNPVTDAAFLFDTSLTTISGTGGGAHAVPLTTTITPFAGDATTSTSTVTMNASSGFSPHAPGIRKVYYQLDSLSGAWKAASGNGPFTASLGNLAGGSHTIHAFATDGQDAPLSTGPQVSPLVGAIASYTFTVTAGKATPTVSLGSSANPSTAGQPVTFTASVSGSAGTATGTITFRDGATDLCSAVALASGAASCVTSALTAGSHSITASYSGNASYDAATSSALTQTVSAPPPASADVGIAQSVSPSAASPGQDVSFTLTVSNAGPAGATGVTVTDTLPAGLTFASASAGCSNASGSVTCTIGSLASGASAQLSIVAHTTSGGAFTNTATVSASQSDPNSANNTSSASVTVNAGTVVNLSTRGVVGTGNDVLIAGFVIGGSSPKTVVVTAAGPSLVQAGIANPLANPTLTLVRSSDGSAIAANDDWGSAANATQIQQSGFAPADAMEPAILMTLPPGAYTAVVSGAGATTGVAVVGVFEVDHPEVPLVNISTRGQVLTGNDVMIGGFIIQGSAPRTVVVTGIGPSLAQAGIANALANPTLTLVRSADGAVIASNDDWAAAPNAASLQAAGLAPADARESAIMLTLPPGAYTTILSGAGSTTGVGIIAVYSQ